MELEKEYNQKTLWARIIIPLLGLWLIVAPLTFDYHNVPLFWSDILTGIAVLILGWINFRKPNPWIKWQLFVAAVWLQLAPLIFWAPNPVTYLNDTLIGALIVGFAILLPTPEELLQETSQEIPPGWSYNPSSWLQRAPVAFFGLLGWFVARYLASYQLGYIDSVWDPFFSDGTQKVITSQISKDFPVSDAGLGAAAYCLEALLACKGGASRWRTMPWMVVFFGILVVPLGIVSITLIMLQPIIVGEWCGLCLILAFCMLVMMALSIDEIVAVIVYLSSSKQSKWDLFWHGGSSPESQKDNSPISLNSPLEESLPAMTRGVTIPWNLWMTTLLGIWQMFATNYIGDSPLDDAIDHTCGALAIVISVLSWAEVTRACRYLNVLVGLALFINVLFIPGHSTADLFNDSLIGGLLIGLSIRRGPIDNQYGSWNSKIF